jgi:hypothetical protein
MAKQDCVMQCANCAFYRAESGEEFGRCHRYPPVWVATPEGNVSDFPSVDDSDFCGEFTRGGQ